MPHPTTRWRSSKPDPLQALETDQPDFIVDSAFPRPPQVPQHIRCRRNLPAPSPRTPAPAVAEMFVSESAVIMSELQAALGEAGTEPNFSEARSVLHKLKGTSSTVGASGCAVRVRGSGPESEPEPGPWCLRPCA